jgi:dihydropteroate synthase
MGVVNVTPDSFFDGGRYAGDDAARERIRQITDLGASVVDIGGESTRPRSEPVPAREQIARIEGAVRYALGLEGVLVSIDTTSPEVADRMLSLGAHIINDVSCLAEGELASVVARHDADLVVMHSRGPMSQMPGYSQYPEAGYQDVVTDVKRELSAARDRAVASGLEPSRVWLDPGIGYNKNARHSYELVRRLSEFRELGAPIVVGPSRKSFIAAASPAPPEARLGGTIAACVLLAQAGADVLRVHDVFEVSQALSVLQFSSEANPGGGGADA